MLALLLLSSLSLTVSFAIHPSVTVAGDGKISIACDGDFVKVLVVQDRVVAQ
jgi:hypothetical protein